MNITEYKTSIDEIREDAKQKMIAVAKQYAMANNPYEIGDMITDHIGSGKILKIGVYTQNPMCNNSNTLPTCRYFVHSYTKAGKRAKRVPERWVYQSNIID